MSHGCTAAVPSPHNFAVVGPGRDPGIPVAMRAAGDQIEQLRAAVEGLRSRLNPLMRADEPVASASIAPRDHQPGERSPLAEVIEDFARQIHSARIEIEALARRIDH